MVKQLLRQKKKKKSSPRFYYNLFIFEKITTLSRVAFRVLCSKTLGLSDLNACFLQRFLSHMVIKLYFCLSAKLFLQFLKVNLRNYQQRDTLGTDFVRLCCFCQKIIDAKSLVLARGIFGLYFMLFKAELLLVT